MAKSKQATEPTYEELKAKVEALEKRSNAALTYKVSEKGGVSVYGLGRFPVTLYFEQWQRLLGASADIAAFLEENKTRLKMKETAA